MKSQAFTNLHEWQQARYTSTLNKTFLTRFNSDRTFKFNLDIADFAQLHEWQQAS